MITKSIIEAAEEKLNYKKDEILKRLKRTSLIDDTKGDEVDEMQINMLNSIQIELSSRDILNLRYIEEALYRIKENNFGNCEECGEYIHEKRLLFLPEVTTCLICAETQEREAKLRARS